MPITTLFFQDYGFPVRRVPWTWPDGRTTERWLPYGMPRIPDRIHGTTFYLFKIDEQTGQTVGPCGTGVLISIPSRFPGKGAIYAVTAKHVVQSGASIIRINSVKPADGELKTTTTDFQFEPHEWYFDPDGADVTAIDVSWALARPFLLAATVPITDLVTIPMAHSLRLRAGEDVFMIGLFTSNPGTQHNNPAVRFGNLSQMADIDNPIMQPHGKLCPSHVVDMHSRAGLSGSPVFVYRTPDSDLSNIDLDGMVKPPTTAKAFVKCLGIHSGQFLESISTEKAEVFPAPIMEGDKLVVQSSMTIVVTGQAIVDLLNKPHFANVRAEWDAQEAKLNAPRVQPESAEAVQASGNPSHKEDFMNLLGAAANANKPAS